MSMVEGCGEIFNVLLMSNKTEKQIEYKSAGGLNWSSIITEN